MNIGYALPSDFRDKLLNAALDFISPDTFVVMLMRDGFSYNASTMKYKKNVSASTSLTSQMSVNATTKTISRTDGGSFITDGYVVGNYITTTNASNNGTYVVRTVAASSLRVDYVSGQALTTVTDVTAVITCEDEKPTGDGYTRGAVNAVFDVVNGNIYMDPFDWSDFGTALNTSQGAIIYDETEAADAIVCYIRFTPWQLQF